MRQIGPHRNVIVVDIVADSVDAAVVIDDGRIVTIVAGRPQPPPACPYNRIPRFNVRQDGNRFLSLEIQAPARVLHPVASTEIC